MRWATSAFPAWRRCSSKVTTSSPSTSTPVERASSHPGSTDECGSSGATSPVRNRSRHALEGVDAVIHLAAIIPPYSERAPDLARKVNLDATRSLIAQMEASPTRQTAGLRVVPGRVRRRPGSRAAADCRHTRLSDRRVRAPKGSVRASDPAIAAAVEHPAACGCHANSLAGAGSQHNVRVQPRRAVRVPPSRTMPGRHSLAPCPVRSRSERRST